MIKNERGLRGIFVDEFLPMSLAETLEETADRFQGSGELFVKSHHISSLAEFVAHSDEARKALEEFLSVFPANPKYIKEFTSGKKVKKFFKRFLDDFGHNSIARMAGLWVCSEEISLLAAKSYEWGRPGVGFIELSTRFAKVSGKSVYPIEEEFACYGVNRYVIHEVVERSFGHYRHFEGEELGGPFPAFLRENYERHYSDSKEDQDSLKMGVTGETYDVLGNFLPACMLTSVGCAISGEAFPELVKHLYLDNTPENIALAEALITESGKLGLDQFLHHVEPTPWKQEFWKYLDPEHYDWWCIGTLSSNSGITLREQFVSSATLPDRRYVEEALVRSFDREIGIRTFDGVMSRLLKTPRGEFDKLPNHFEKIAGEFAGVMSFRGWRDLQRQGFCTHNRTLLTPQLGFYRYDKPAPKGFYEACIGLHRLNLATYAKLLKAPAEMRQYPMALGNLIGFEIGGNLAQMEFCNWQRTKYSVNHEVRQVFLGIEERLRKAYPWWHKISRADTTKAYVFARGKKAIPLGK